MLSYVDGISCLGLKIRSRHNSIDVFRINEIEFCSGEDQNLTILMGQTNNTCRTIREKRLFYPLVDSLLHSVVI